MFSGVVGNPQVISRLQKAVELGRVGGSYIFYGAEGVGKEFVALQLAKALNCLNFDFDNCDSCETCRSCKKINDNNHPDVQLVKPEGAWLRIGQIRDLQSRISYRPMEGKRKVYIISQAEKMNLEAANCLLKTLEEPPGDSILILVTSAYSSLLETVRSRCQSFRFQLIPSALIAEYLTEKLSLSDKDARSAASISDGSFEKALQIAENLEFVAEEDIPEIIRGLASVKIFRFAEELGSKPDKIKRLILWYRDLLLIKQGIGIGNRVEESELSLTHPDRYKELVEIAKGYSITDICKAIREIMEAEKLLTRNINSTLTLEVLAFKLNALKLRT